MESACLVKCPGLREPWIGPIVFMDLCPSFTMLYVQLLQFCSDMALAWPKKKKSKEEKKKPTFCSPSNPPLSFVWPIFCSHFAPQEMLCVIAHCVTAGWPSHGLVFSSSHWWYNEHIKVSRKNKAENESKWPKSKVKQACSRKRSEKQAIVEIHIRNRLE